MDDDPQRELDRKTNVIPDEELIEPQPEPEQDEAPDDAEDGPDPDVAPVED